MSRPILPTDLNRTRRSESLRKMSLQKVKPLIQPFTSNGQVALKNIVEQVLKYFFDIIEVLLLQANSNRYLEFMEKNQEMDRELERKMEMLIQQKYEQLRKIIVRDDDILKEEKIQRIDRNAILKKQRRQVTQSIINFHRFDSQGEELKLAQHLQEVPRNKPAKAQIDAIEQDFFVYKEMRTSMQLNSINSQISQLQRNQNNAIQQLRKQLQAKILHNFKDIEMMNWKHLEFKLKFQQKLEQNLTALWNVISDIKTSVFMLQTRQKIENDISLNLI